MSQPCLALPALNAAALLASLVLTIGDANAARVILGAPAGEANLTMGCLYPMAGRAAMYGQDSIASTSPCATSRPNAPRGAKPHGCG